jgi:hypothetical protein
MTITQRPTTVVPSLHEAYTLYADVFAEVNALAAQRHLMTEDEFANVYNNPGVLKFYVFDDDDKLIGLSVLTNDLAEWPLASQECYARRWPEHYARGAIWYVGFVGAAPNHSHAFRKLIVQMYKYVIGNNGLAAMDFCTYNMIERRLPEITLMLLGRINPAASMEVIDTQTTVLYRFDKGA